MKKFYFLLLGVMLSALSMQADDYTITLNLDDASRYQVLVGQEEKTDLVTGDNVITAPENTYVTDGGRLPLREHPAHRLRVS